MNPSTDEGRALLALVADMGGQGIDPMAGARWRELGRLVLALEARSSHSDTPDVRRAISAAVIEFPALVDYSGDAAEFIGHLRVALRSALARLASSDVSAGPFVARVIEGSVGPMWQVVEGDDTEATCIAGEPEAKRIAAALNGHSDVSADLRAVARAFVDAALRSLAARLASREEPTE